jgi:hypothetical protein
MVHEEYQFKINPKDVHIFLGEKKVQWEEESDIRQ